MRTYTPDQPIDVLVWDNKKKASEWLPGRFLSKVSATDRPHRYNVILDDGRAFNAACPNCVKPRGTMPAVKVMFEDEGYNYTTPVASQITDVEAQKYFVDQWFNMGTGDKDNLQKCIKIEFNAE
mgnify:CR=1 FL=1